MNTTTFLFQLDLALVMITALGCLALCYAAANAACALRLRRGCALAWFAFVALAVCLIVAFKARYPGLETAPRLIQWQLGASLAAGALLLRVSLLKLAVLDTAMAAGKQGEMADVARGIRWQLAAAALLLGGGAILSLSSNYP